MAQDGSSAIEAASDRRRQERLAAARSLAAALGARGARRVVLFGSLAAPSAWIGENSDVDIAVVVPGMEEVPFHRRLADDPDVIAFPFVLDLLAYTPDEWAHLSRERGFVRREITELGLPLHE